MLRNHSKASCLTMELLTSLVWGGFLTEYKVLFQSIRLKVSCVLQFQNYMQEGDMLIIITLKMLFYTGFWKRCSFPWSENWMIFLTFKKCLQQGCKYMKMLFFAFTLYNILVLLSVKLFSYACFECMWFDMYFLHEMAL